MATFDKSPKITGNFSQWKSNDMLRIDIFYDCLQRNSLPTTRHYVEDKNTLVSRIAKIINKDIYIMYRNQK
jgi:hypothetical protein